MPDDNLKPLYAAASRAVFRAERMAGVDVPADCDEVVELRQARAGIIAEVGRLKVVRRELAEAPMTDEQRAEHTLNIEAEIRGLINDFRTMGALMRGIRRGRQAAYLAAAGTSVETAAQ